MSPAQSAYVANELGGGNPENVLVRAILCGRNTPEMWQAEYLAARGHAGRFSGQMARNMERAGMLSETGGVWSLTTVTLTHVETAVARYRDAMAALGLSDRVRG